MFELTLFERSALSPEDVPSIRSAIELFAGLAKASREEGLLALEERLPAIEDDFSRRGLALVLDGKAPELVAEILVHSIRASDARGPELRRMMVSALGVLSLQEGLSPEDLELRLQALLPESSPRA